MHFLHDALHDFNRARRSRHDPGAKCGEVEFAKLWMVEFGDEHGRHTMQRRATFLRHRLQRMNRTEVWSGDDYGCAVRHASQVPHYHPETVIERHRNAESILMG